MTIKTARRAFALPGGLFAALFAVYYGVEFGHYPHIGGLVFNILQGKMVFIHHVQGVDQHRLVIVGAT